MQIIAYGLATGNPFAYLLIIILFEPPVMIIGWYIVDKIKEWLKKKD